ncbi:phage tail protein [Terrihalobacillus insolitus]|uniref:phage tail protein n=1 Tax=Terrihalobacillus insolitus TaxID=2950438 RepID=UPI0023417AEF|nr:phage tail protein [Terrihalobacillus insolitus]MDC3412512.1 phage tail protein [Terrihalobacillus insolitus]
MIPITDVNGNSELLTNTKIKRKRKVNGEKTLSFFVVPDESNKHSFPLVDSESIIEFNNEEYVIKVVKEKNAGQKTIKQVEAVHRFFHDMINAYQYDLHNGSMTFSDDLTFVFSNTPYTFSIIDTFYAESFQNFGRDNCLSLFKKVIERYGAEFRVEGTHVYLEREIGSKTDFQYRYKHNVKTIDKEINTHNLATIIRGYGGEPDDNGVYPIEEEYISPNYDKFGEMHAPAVVDERITTIDGMQDRLQKDIVDEPQLSLTIDIVDLRSAGYNYNTANEGDYGFIIYEPMSVDIEARIVEINEDFDYNLKPIKTAVTISNLRQNATDVMTRLSQTSKTVDRLMRGQEKIPYNVLDSAVKNATESLQSAQTELEFENGIIARDKNDPNLLVLFNSNGIGISTDGGATFTEAITSDGFVLSAGAIGQLEANNIKIGVDSTYENGYDPTTKETPSGAQSKVDTADAALRNDLSTGTQKVTTTSLEGAIDTAANNIKQDSNFYWNETGFFAIDPNNINNIVRITSGGIGVSTDGGTTYRTAMTGDGIVADVITSGYMAFNRAKGGILTLGIDEQQGILRALNSNGDVVTELTGDSGGFNELFVGDLRSNKVTAPNIVTYGKSNSTLYYYISVNGDDNSSGSSTSPLATFDEAMKRVPKIYDGDVYIVFSTDYNAACSADGYSGSGRLHLDLNGYKLKNYLSLSANTKTIQIKNGEIVRSGGSALIFSTANAHVYLLSVILNGDGQSSGVDSAYGDSFYASSTEVYNVVNCFHSDNLSQLMLRSCKGLGSDYGVRLDSGSRLSAVTSIPDGGISSLGTFSGSFNFGDTTGDSGTATSPTPTKTEVIETFAQTGSANWRENYGGQWNANNTYPYQGDWDGWGLYKGLWLFGNNIYNKVNGKTINKIRIRPHRRSSGGYSSSVDVEFRHHNYASQPSGEPTVSSDVYAAGFKWGEEKWITLPSAFRTAFTNGAKGFGIYTTNTSNTKYAIFETAIDVEITYET